jgi:predicted glycoside hydrolase/deacetylase ChbG (UPF0249 family)
MKCEAPRPAEACEQACENPPASRPGSMAGAAPQSHPFLIVNADDWALNRAVTDRILACARSGALSSASAMVFMDDSERAACLAREHQIDVGLHLNFSSAFTSPDVPSQLREHQRRIIAFLRFKRYARVLFNPLLTGSFEYVTKAQIEEFERLYSEAPGRVDGHHHMHLCANVVAQKLLPKYAIVRRNQSFAAGEMGALNRWYRRSQDRFLARHYTTTDYFFDLCPIEDSRLDRIMSLARASTVEIATHPFESGEYEFLMSRGLASHCKHLIIARGYTLRPSRKATEDPESQEHQP